MQIPSKRFQTIYALKFRFQIQCVQSSEIKAFTCTTKLEKRTSVAVEARCNYAHCRALSRSDLPIVLFKDVMVRALDVGLGRQCITNRVDRVEYEMSGSSAEDIYFSKSLER